MNTNAILLCSILSLHITEYHPRITRINDGEQLIVTTFAVQVADYVLCFRSMSLAGPCQARQTDLGIHIGTFRVDRCATMYVRSVVLRMHQSVRWVGDRDHVN
jgi:hypothetical protein